MAGFIADGAVIEELLHSEQGPVLRDIAERAQRVQEAAKTFIPLGAGPGPHLRDAVVKRFGQDEQGPYVAVIAGPDGTVPYALPLDQGADPHDIFPHKPGGVLAFYWAKAGKVVFLRHVHHPGSPGLQYMERALQSA